MVAILARYAARFSVRALDLTVDSSLLWVGVALATAAAVLLAFVPRLPSADATTGIGLSSGGTVRITSGTNRRLRLFAVTQIAASFVLLAGSGMLLDDAVGAAATQTGFDMERVLAIDVPIVSYERKPQEMVGFYKEVLRRDRGACPAWSARRSAPSCRGATRASSVRDSSSRCRATRAPTAKRIRAADSERSRPASSTRWACRSSPGATSPRPIARDSEKVVIVSQSLARRMFPTQDALNHYFMWTDPVMQFIDVSTGPRRIVGIVADIDDEDVVPGPGDEHLPAVRSGDRRRPPVRAHEDEPVRAGAADHADHPVAVAPSSRSRRPRRSRTSARKCWRPIG